MKKFFCGLSVVFLVSLVYYVFSESMSFSIPAFDLYLSNYETRLLTVMMTVIWLCLPIRKICCNGSLSEVAFNLFPLDVVLMLNLAQWSFPAFIGVWAVLLVLEAVMIIGFRIAEEKRLVTKSPTVNSTG